MLENRTTTNSGVQEQSGCSEETHPHPWGVYCDSIRPYYHVLRRKNAVMDRMPRNKNLASEFSHNICALLKNFSLRGSLSQTPFITGARLPRSGNWCGVSVF